MEKKDKTKIWGIFFSFLFTVLLAFSFLTPLFRMVLTETTIRIEDTAVKHGNSWGTDVRIQSVKINGVMIPLEELSCDSGWENVDDLFLIINPPTPTEVTLQVQNAQEIEIEFWAQEGSGIVKIYENERVIGTIDLYSPNWRKITFNRKLGTVSIFNNIPVFLLLWGISFLLIQNWFRFIWKKIKRDVAIGGVKKEIIICLMILLGSGYFDELQSGLKNMFLCVILFVVGLSVFTWREVLYERHKEYLADGLIWSFTSGIVFYGIERVNGNLKTIEIPYLLGNVIIYSAIILFFCLLCRKIKWGLIVGVIVLFLFGVANYYVVLFRGSPIVPGDFFAFQTAKTVLFNYHYEIGWTLYSSTIVMVSWCILVGTFSHTTEKMSGKALIMSCALLGSLAGAIIKMDFFKPTLDLWNLNTSTSQYGVAVCLVSNIRGMCISVPQGYSYERVEELSERYQIETVVANEPKPNVIIIMNESFSDLSVLSKSLDNNTYMPYYNSLKDNTIKGTALVSTIGGGTANSEYEFLTGNTMAFVPGTVPYLQFVLKKSYSLVQTFKDLGYNTTAIHPYDTKGYNRYKVYPFFGFNSFLGIEDFPNAELERKLFITDEESYKKVIEVFEADKEKEIPSFIFNVTIQNHSGYTTGYYGDDRIKIAGMEGEYPGTEEYLTLVKKSDEDLQVLIEYFSSIEEPTVILFFGDHLPKVEDGFYEKMLNKSMSQWSLAENQSRYEIPFFIWANYEIEERENVFTSLNYLSGLLFKVAGIPVTAYQNYLIELSQVIPAMNVNGYMNAKGEWHSYTEERSENILLDDYKNIQYNNIFAKKKCSQWFSLNDH